MDKQNNRMEWLNKVAQTVARKLNNWINPLSGPTKKMGSIIIGFAIAITCLALIFRSAQTEENSNALMIDSITKPIDIRSDSLQVTPETDHDIITQYNRMIYFKSLIDKLNATQGKQAFDSLMHAHPGLRDSLEDFITNYYKH